jgi:hypothetical protein
MRAYLVWNENAEEGVVFADENDAIYAATGMNVGFGVSTLADEWRETYGEDDEQYEVKEIEIEGAS